MPQNVQKYIFQNFKQTEPVSSNISIALLQFQTDQKQSRAALQQRNANDDFTILTMSTCTTVAMSTSTTSSVLSLSVRLCCSPLGGGAALGGTLPPGGGCRQLWAQGGQMVQRHQSCTHRHTRLSQHLSALDSTSSEPRLARLPHERKVSWL